jgi:hypothetical protein
MAYVPSVDISGNPLSGDAWNQAWNQNWNTAWNEGYNAAQNAPTGSSPYWQGGNVLGGSEGFNAGVQEYLNRSNVAGDKTIIPSNSNNTIVPTQNLNVGDNNVPSGPSPEEQARIDAENQVRSGINSGYDNYFASLNDQLNSLPGQAETQNQLVQNQYTMGVGDLNLQKTQGEQQFANQRGEVTTNQNKNLKNIDENLRNLFMAGNVYLGARGAGDSSAANQYAYALTKQGNQARGDQMAQAAKSISEIQARETNLKNIVDNEMTKLKTEYDSKKLEIAQWLNTAQQQVKTAIANGQLSRSTDLANLSKSLLDQGLAALRDIQTNYANRENSLITWAESNSTNLNQLKANLQQIMSIAPTLASGATVNGAITTDAQGNATMNPLIGYGSNTETKKSLFG